LGLCNYYELFVKGFNINKVLTQLKRIHQKYIWGEAQKHAFQELKAQLTSMPILQWFIWG
jgi:hypothetical protein